MLLSNKIFKIEKLYGIGTYWNFEFYEKVDLENIKVEIEKIITKFDNLYSRFKSDSLISELNILRELENPPQDLLLMIRKSLAFYKDSKGVFNIGVGKILENFGYDKDYSFKKSNFQIKIPNLVDLIKIEKNKIKLTGEGKIDLGGIGKGYLIEKLSKYFQEKLNLKYFLINGGGDIFATSNDEEDIEIYLQSPMNSHEYLFKTLVKNAAICSSSSMKRRWKDYKTNKIYTHLINTNNPENSDLRISFVSAPSIVDADVFATILTFPQITLTQEVINKYNLKFITLNNNLEIKNHYKLEIYD